MSRERGLDQNRLREWLGQGWILERRSTGPKPSNTGASGSQGDFLIGGGVVAGLALADLEQASCAVWAPAFFSDSNEISTSPQALSGGAFQSRWSMAIGRDELLKWLNEISVPSAKVSWIGPNEENFRKAFSRIGHAFREEGVKKAVPVVFARGRVAMSDRAEWISDRVRAGLAATSSNDLRLYGLWSAESGFLGATPEDLFTRQAGVLTSMAVAGTRALSSLGDRADDADAQAKLVEDFLKDPKERSEHDLVVQDIERIFAASHGLAAGTDLVEKSTTTVERFGALFHLVTHLSKKSDEKSTIASLVQGLHPTPALGSSPREPSLKLLKELHEICGDGVARENFGAPFVVKFEDEVHAIVAIRQIRWVFDDTDRAEIVVGSGCGIVSESEVDREWNELAAKRQAVMRLFRLSLEKSEPVFWSLEILQKIVSVGVRRIIVCAGARNAPLVVAAEAMKGLVKVESFFEERAAAFYALGLSRASGEPVAILTTSGTAVSELLPAMTEADYSGVPLIAVTADRPRRLRLSGAPQTISQTRIFSDVTEKTWDIEEGDRLVGFERMSMQRPLHVNVCLEEPLLADAEREPGRLFEKARANVLATKSTIPSEDLDLSSAFAAWSDFNSRPGMKVAIVGALAPIERDAVAGFLERLQYPVLLEGPSGLRGDPRLRALELCGGDRDFQKFVLEGKISGVLRLGGVPTTRVWRDLDDVNVATQTLSISKLRFSGLGRGGFIYLPQAFNEFLSRVTPKPVVEGRGLELLAVDRITAAKLDQAIQSNPNSEPAMVREFSKLVVDNGFAYVGNSLPIRWWDLAATRERVMPVEANRGVNGIDGQLSTALGFATASGRDAWILLGDLTALYDLAAPWAIRSTKSQKIRIVILNNSGGRIFNRVLAKAPGGSAPFENEHELNFELWAKMWKLDYAVVRDSTKLSSVEKSLGSHAVIEIIPSADETARFWKGLT